MDDEKRNGGSGVLINWRVIKSRSDTPVVEVVPRSRYTSKTPVTVKDIGLAGRYPATSGLFLAAPAA